MCTTPLAVTPASPGRCWKTWPSHLVRLRQRHCSSKNVPLVPRDVAGLEKESISFDGRHPVGGCSRDGVKSPLDSVAADRHGIEVSFSAFPGILAPHCSPN